MSPSPLDVAVLKLEQMLQNPEGSRVSVPVEDLRRVLAALAERSAVLAELVHAEGMEGAGEAVEDVGARKRAALDQARSALGFSGAQAGEDIAGGQRTPPSRSAMEIQGK